MSSINPEYLRIQKLRCIDYTTTANKNNLLAWLSYRKYYAESTKLYNNDSLVLDGLKAIDEKILEFLNIPVQNLVSNDYEKAEIWDKMKQFAYYPPKETIDVLQLVTKDQYLGKAGLHIVMVVDSKNVTLTKDMLLRTEWLEMSLLRIVDVKTELDNTKTITCVLNTGNLNEYLPTEYLDPTTQIQRDRIPLEIIKS